MIRVFVAAAFILLGTLVQAQSILRLSFGQAGKMSLAVDSVEEAVDVAVLSGDSLLILAQCGHGDTSSFDMDAALIKTDRDGNIDASFGQGGIVKFDFEGMDHSTPRQVMKMNDGSIIVLGEGYAFANPYYVPVCMTRIHPNGQIDVSFGNNGTVETAFWGYRDIARAFTTDAVGNFLIAAASFDSLADHLNPAAARLDAAGIPDPSFGATGKLVLDFVGGFQDVRMAHLAEGQAYDVMPLPDGTLLVAGSFTGFCFVVKLLPDGTRDSTFNNEGTLFFQFDPMYNNRVCKMVMLPGSTLMIGVMVDKTYDRDYYMQRIDPYSGAMLASDYIDYSAHEDMLYDMVLTPTGELAAAGRCIKPQNALTQGYRSDYFSVTVIPDPLQLSAQQKILVAFDNPYQGGGNAVAVQSDGSIICAGFTEITGGSDIAVIAIDPGYYLSVDEINAPDGAAIYPNPAREHITAEIKNMKGAVVRMHDSNGKLVKELPMHTDSSSIPVNDLAPGVYSVTVIDENGSIALRRRVVVY